MEEEKSNAVKRTSTRKTVKRKLIIEDEGNDTDEFEFSDPDDFSPPNKKRKAPPKKQTAESKRGQASKKSAAGKSKKQKEEESDDDEDFDDWKIDVEEGEFIPEEPANWKDITEFTIHSHASYRSGARFDAKEDKPKIPVYVAPLKIGLNPAIIKKKIEVQLTDKKGELVNPDHEWSVASDLTNFLIAQHKYGEEECAKLWTYKATIGSSPEKVKISFTLNVSRLEFLVKNGLPVPGRDFIFSDLEDEVFQDRAVDFKAYMEPNHRVVPSVLYKQLPRLKLKLYKYQLEEVSWMKQLEENIDNPIQFSTLATWKKGETELLFEGANRRFYLEPALNGDMRSRGGILADEMGLGKTISLIGLFLSNPKTLQTPRSSLEDEFHWSSKATLICAPNHLCKQWADEIAKHTKPQLKVLLITTKPQHVKYDYRDFIKADVVIVSFQLLKNKNYLKAASLNRDAGDRFNQIRTTIQEIKRRPDLGLSVKQPPLEHFFWHRFIIDEAHEILSQPYYAAMVSQIPSRYRWYVTGTPFPNKQASLDAALQFIDWKSTHQQKGSWSGYHRHAGAYVDWVVNDLIINNFYWRHTKESIGTEYNVPSVVEVMLLDMSEVERGMYYSAAGDELRLRQLCCHPQISDQDRHILGDSKKTLEEIRVLFVEHTQKEFERVLSEIEEVQEEKKELERSAKTNADKEKLRAKESTLTRLQTQSRQLKSSLAYFASIMPKISQSTSEPCVICFDDIVALTITSCGHFFCKQCVQNAVSSQKKCPVCRNPLTMNQLTEVLDEGQEEELEATNSMKEMIDKYGTKMAHLVKYLNEVWENEADGRVIIFSQWDKMLHQIGDSLKENGIKTVYVKGNVHQRNKAISTFKSQDDVRVIMLSLENAASGTNLTEASHIILIDPIAGTKEQATAIESQAIGRAHRQGQKQQVSVMRMIMKDTVEHKFFLRNRQEDSMGSSNRFVRSNSITTSLARSSELIRSRSLRDIIMKSP